MATDNSDAIGRWAFIGCCIGAGIFMLANGIDCRTADTCSTTFFGSGGILGGMGTLGAMVAAVFAARAYFVNRLAAIGTRFQKGAELLGNENSSVRLAALTTLRDAAREDPKHYLSPVVRTITGFIAERDSEFKASYEPFVLPYQPPAKLRPMRSDYGTAEALTVLGKIAPLMPKDISEFGPGERNRLMVHDMYLAGTAVTDSDFSRMDFGNCIFNQVAFRRCNFSGCELNFVSLQIVVFDDCNLTDAILNPHHPWGEMVTTPLHMEELLISDGDLTGATIAGMTFQAYQIGSQTAKRRHLRRFDGGFGFMVRRPSDGGDDGASNGSPYVFRGQPPNRK